MFYTYLVAGAIAGHLFIEIVCALSPRSIKVPWFVNILGAFVGGVAVHYLITH